MTRKREFTVRASVYVRNLVGTNKWLTGEIVAKTGPVSYVVKLASAWWPETVKRRQRLPLISVIIRSIGLVWMLNSPSLMPDSEGDTVEPRRTYPRRTRNPGKMWLWSYNYVIFGCVSMIFSHVELSAHAHNNYCARGWSHGWLLSGHRTPVKNWLYSALFWLL